MTPKQANGSVANYLASQPTERRRELQRVRSVVRKRLPKGYRETLTSGMIVYEVPLAVYPDTYNGHALWYAALGAQKNYLTLYLMGVYGSTTLQQALKDGFKAAGKKLDMGKACIRFQAADDLDLDTIGELVARVPLEEFVASAKSARRR